MPSGLLLVLVLIPSMVFFYVVLSTFYEPTRAYIAISGFPIAYVLVIWAFRMLLHFQHLSDEWWQHLATTIGWVSLAQAVLGIGLIVRALYKKEGIVSLLLATSVSGYPFVLRFIR
jgi:heme/copper-type cytochrome/quinol oxidase subunit 4